MRVRRASAWRSRPTRATAATAAFVGLAMVAARPARAEPDGAAKTDTSHGRLDGDLAVAAGIGAAFGPRGPRAAIDLRLRYLSTAGIFATYEDGPFLASDAEPKRALAIGVELRPLFLARWAQGLESGNAWLDLTVDSFALELGAVLMQPAGRPFGRSPGLQIGVGFEIPILPHASGPYVGVHAGGRWSGAALAGDIIDAAGDRSGTLLLTLGFGQIFGAHVVDLGDRAP